MRHTDRLRRLDRQGEAALSRWRSRPSPGPERALVFWGRHFVTGEEIRRSTGRSWGFGHGVLGALAWCSVAIAEALDGHWRSAGSWAALFVLYLGLIFFALTAHVRYSDDDE